MTKTSSTAFLKISDIKVKALFDNIQFNHTTRVFYKKKMMLGRAYIIKQKDLFYITMLLPVLKDDYKSCVALLQNLGVQVMLKKVRNHYLIDKINLTAKVKTNQLTDQNFTLSEV